MLKYDDLKTRHRVIRDRFGPSLSLRTLSWLNRAEQETSDDDARFLFLWIAFTAAYSNELPDHQAFWDYQSGKITESDWQTAFDKSKAAANRAQMKDGANILGYLVPTVIHLMLENHNQVWGEACYPVVD